MLFALMLHHGLHSTYYPSTREALACTQIAELRSATTSCRHAALSLQPREDAARRIALSHVFTGPGSEEVLSMFTIALGACLPSNRLYIPCFALPPNRGSMTLSACCLTPSKPFSLELACQKELFCNPERGFRIHSWYSGPFIPKKRDNGGMRILP